VWSLCSLRFNFFLQEPLLHTKLRKGHVFFPKSDTPFKGASGSTQKSAAERDMDKAKSVARGGGSGEAGCEALCEALRLLRRLQARAGGSGRCALAKPLYAPWSPSEPAEAAGGPSGGSGGGCEPRRLLRLERAQKRVHECSHACACAPVCPGRLVQKGPQPPLEVFWAGDGVGFGVRCPIGLPSNLFVCEYAGEIIDRKEDANARESRYRREGRSQYILPLGDSRSAFAIDATLKGNVARFLNHSCDPNLNKVEAYVDHGDKRHFRVAFFTARAVEPGAELTWSYGSAYKPTDQECSCGAKNCKGYLPY